jgi:hypothetical protein
MQFIAARQQPAPARQEHRMTPTQLEVQGQAIFIAALIQLVLGGMSALLIVNWWRAARGDLARNPYLGIRTESTLRNEQTWVAGNRAAIRTAPLYLLFNAALAAALFPAAWHGWRLVICLVGGAGFVVLIGLMIWSAVVGSRAARQVGGPKDPRAGLSPNLETPAVTVKLSERQKTILGWVCAAIGCGLTLLLLGNIIDGYVLALHHQLVPADHFGFRDETTTSCWPRWYASQIAGFRWMLFGYGPVLIAGMAIFIGAAHHRRPPVDFVVLAPGIVFFALPFVIAAGIHAGTVARAITCS